MFFFALYNLNEYPEGYDLFNCTNFKYLYTVDAENSTDIYMEKLNIDPRKIRLSLEMVLFDLEDTEFYDIVISGENSYFYIPDIDNLENIDSSYTPLCMVDMPINLSNDHEISKYVKLQNLARESDMILNDRDCYNRQSIARHIILYFSQEKVVDDYNIDQIKNIIRINMYLICESKYNSEDEDLCRYYHNNLYKKLKIVENNGNYKFW